MESFVQKVFVFAMILIFWRSEIAAGNTVCYEFVSGNHSFLCPHNSFINMVQSENIFITRWKFCCSPQSIGIINNGGYSSDHSAFRQPFELGCGENHVVTGLTTNISNTWHDRIWSLHCTELYSSHALVNCTWAIQHWYEGVFNFTAPNSISVVTAIKRTIGSLSFVRTWFFRICSTQAYCALDSRVSTPEGGVVTENNSSLYIDCPSGTYTDGPVHMDCSDLANATVSKCERCKTIDFCLNTTCDSPLFSICLKCADVHPVWKIPVVANRRKRKCRVPPVIQSSSKLQEVALIRGQNIRLPCVALGIPKPKITWTFNGTLVPWGMTSTDNSLYVSIASLNALLNSDTNIEGIYTCFARNVVGNDSIEYNLYEVLQTSVFVQQVVNSAEGEEANLVCPVEEYDSIEWLNCSEHRREYQQLRNNNQISIINDSQVLRIYPVSIYHAGVYSCRAYYGGFTTKATVSLKIFATSMETSGSGLLFATTPPKMINWRLNYTVAIGGNISLHCEASGYPPPIVYWKQGDEILLSGLSRVSLSFVNASTSAAGVYSCIANSMYNDEISRTTFLTVIPPRVHLRPTTPFHESTFSLPTVFLPTNYSTAVKLSHLSLTFLLLIVVIVINFHLL